MHYMNAGQGTCPCVRCDTVWRAGMPCKSLAPESVCLIYCSNTTSYAKRVPVCLYATACIKPGATPFAILSRTLANRARPIMCLCCPVPCVSVCRVLLVVGCLMMLVLVFGLVYRVGEGKHMCMYIVYCGSSLIDDIFMPEQGEESTLCGHKDWCRECLIRFLPKHAKPMRSHY